MSTALKTKQKDAAYEAWFRTKVQLSLDRADRGEAKSFTSEELLASIRERVLARADEIKNRQD
jgi:hypothetical protein